MLGVQEIVSKVLQLPSIEVEPLHADDVSLEKVVLFEDGEAEMEVSEIEPSEMAVLVSWVVAILDYKALGSEVRDCWEVANFMEVFRVGSSEGFII